MRKLLRFGRLVLQRRTRRIPVTLAQRWQKKRASWFTAWVATGNGRGRSWSLLLALRFRQGTVILIKGSKPIVKNVKSTALLTIAALAILFSCSSAPTVEAQVRATKDRKTAPDFSLKDENGKTVKLSDYRGKVVLLNFWATWCGPCKVEIPWFMEFEQQYKDKGFAVLGVAMDDEGWQAVKPYLTERKVNYRMLLGDDSVTQLYGGVDSCRQHS